MSVANFVPTIWSGRLLAHLDKGLVYADVGNRDYEGEISSFGDTVKINQIGDVTIGDYVKGTTTITPEQLDSTQTTLTIDKAKYFAFKVEDIDKAQANVNIMDAAMGRAGYGIRDVVDQGIATALAAGAGLTYGDDTTPIEVTKDNILDTIALLSEKLTEANVPQEGRFLVVPPWIHTLMTVSKIITQTDNTAALVNGRIAENFYGFDVRISNNVPNTTGAKYKIMAGTNIAFSFAQQIASIEAYRPEDSFSDAVKGLHVYGYKVVQPDALICLTANKKTS